MDPWICLWIIHVIAPVAPSLLTLAFSRLGELAPNDGRNVYIQLPARLDQGDATGLFARA
jgi:hypothetical protein